MKKAYSYIRFSTPNQALGDSSRRQVERSKEYAAQHGLDLDVNLTYKDLGVSAFDESNIKSGALKSFVDACEQGIIPKGAVLLVESLDRLSRVNAWDATNRFRDILEYGVQIVTLMDGKIYSSESLRENWTDFMMSVVIMARANEESKTKSDRLKQIWIAKRRAISNKKLTRICPAWLKLNENRNAYIIIEEKAATIREIVRLVMSGMGKNAISKRFNQMGITSVGMRNKEQSWFPSYISKILSSRALIGEFQPHHMLDGKRIPIDEPEKDYFPAIISEDEFTLVQQKIAARGTKSGGNRGKLFSNLFTGRVRCGYCESTMVFVNKGDDKRGKRTQKLNRFLVCHKAKRGAGCYYVPWTYADFESGFLQYARGIDFATFVNSALSQAPSPANITDQIMIKKVKMDDLVARRNSLIDVLEKSTEQPQVILERVIQYEAQIETISAELLKLEEESLFEEGRLKLTADAIESIVQLIDQLDTKIGDDLYLLRARLNEHICRIVERINVFPGGTIHSAEEIEMIKKELEISSKYTPDQIEMYLAKAISNKPRKEERYFVIKNNDQTMQVLRPDHLIPDMQNAMVETPALVEKWFERHQRTK